VVSALLRTGQGLPPPRDNPMSADRVRWEHIQRVFEQCNRNGKVTKIGYDDFHWGLLRRLIG
jgi:ActR/RegA family two-component response regulator